VSFKEGKIKIYLTWTGILMEGHFTFDHGRCPLRPDYGVISNTEPYVS
jgi:hypothetical protein